MKTIYYTELFETLNEIDEKLRVCQELVEKQSEPGDVTQSFDFAKIKAMIIHFKIAMIEDY